MAKPPDPQRNIPRQDRARRTVEAFFEATAQLLNGGPDSAVTTNRIAERAGFSIGTLYRYFSGKPSLFTAMAIHEMDRQEREVCAALADTRADTVADIVRLAVRPALGAFKGRTIVRAKLVRAALGIPGMGERYEQMITAISRALVVAVTTKALDCTHHPSPAAEFIMMRGVIGAIRSDVVFGDGNRVGTVEFEDALIESVSLHFTR
ncbi:TetR family transcriptional regulator [Methylobacterium indicum]|uniref:TetR family transcriptional regulator n=2 Tax=Methylobacterium indicum TaxID=1775910 RepID=A0A8H9C6I8_9HYPH|nr:TetR family transcriptional regulator [Methylobacterium indicum]